MKMFSDSGWGKTEYFLLLEFTTVFGAMGVYFVNLKYVGCMSPKQDIWMAYECVGIAALLTYYMTCNSISVWQGLFGIVIGIFAYTLCIYWSALSGMCSVFLIISLAIALASVLLYFVRGKRRKRSVVSYIFHRIVDSFFLIRPLLAVLGIVACVTITVSYISHADRMNTQGKIDYAEEDYQIREVYGDEYNLANNLDRIKPVIDEEEWESLSLEQRQDTVTAVIECEARYLGIPVKLKIKYSDEMEYEDKGFYLDAERLICINNEGLRRDGGIAALVCALHEVRHAYQAALSKTYLRLSPEERNMLCYYGVNEWCENFNNYYSPEEGYHEYYTEALEVDARDFSYQEAHAYIEQIRMRLEEKEALFQVKGN